jgi:hypothetical protein
MPSTKIRTTIIAAVTAFGVAGVSVVPTVAQAQVNNFGFLRSNEGYKLKNQGGSMPCQPTFPVENPGSPTGVPPIGHPISAAGFAAVKSAQEETQALVGPLQTQTCEADSGKEVAY